MVPESTLDELEAAWRAVLGCLRNVGLIVVGIKNRIEYGELGAANLVEAIREGAPKLLENYRALNAALTPRVLHDFLAASNAPVEIGEFVAESAHVATLHVSHQALFALDMALKPPEYRPSQAPESQLQLVDFNLEAVVGDPEGAAGLAMRRRGTVFDQLSLKELTKVNAILIREFAAARGAARSTERRLLMRPSEFAAIRPLLERAVDDIDCFLNGEEECEKATRELFKLHDSMEAGETPPEVKGRGKPVELTPEQYAALEWRTVDGEPITDEQREAVLAKLPGEPMSDEGGAALHFALRGGWRGSSRQAAVWLRNAGETVAADGIDEALRRLPDVPRDVTELPGYREVMRTAARHVKAVLVACLADSAATPQNPGKTTTPTKQDDEMAEDGEVTGGKNQETRNLVCQSKKVKLFGPGEQPEVNGKRKPTLTAARYDAVQALIEAGEAGLTKDQLDRQSGHTEARKLLKALANDDDDWKKVIRFPGTPGKGYRID